MRCRHSLIYSLLLRTEYSYASCGGRANGSREHNPTISSRGQLLAALRYNYSMTHWRVRVGRQMRFVSAWGKGAREILLRENVQRRGRQQERHAGAWRLPGNGPRPREPPQSQSYLASRNPLSLDPRADSVGITPSYYICLRWSNTNVPGPRSLPTRLFYTWAKRRRANRSRLATHSDTAKASFCDTQRRTPVPVDVVAWTIAEGLSAHRPL